MLHKEVLKLALLTQNLNEGDGRVDHAELRKDENDSPDDESSDEFPALQYYTAP
jgi:hypothetical protein